MRQEPDRCRMGGFSNKDCRPIDPAPIFQIVAYKDNVQIPSWYIFSHSLKRYASPWSTMSCLCFDRRWPGLSRCFESPIQSRCQETNAYAIYWSSFWNHRRITHSAHWYWWIRRLVFYILRIVFPIKYGFIRVLINRRRSVQAQILVIFRNVCLFITLTIRFGQKLDEIVTKTVKAYPPTSFPGVTRKQIDRFA
jgi:hypothetical protein